MAQEETRSHPLPPIPTSSNSSERWEDEQDGEESLSFTHERQESWDSMQRSPPVPSISLKRKPVPAPGSEQPHVRVQQAPGTPVSIRPPLERQDSETAELTQASIDDSYAEWNYNDDLGRSSGTWPTPDSSKPVIFEDSMPIRSRESSAQARVGDESTENGASSESFSQRGEESGYVEQPGIEVAQSEGLQYHAFEEDFKRHSRGVSALTNQSALSNGSGGERRIVSEQLGVPRTSLGPRPSSAYSDLRGRTLSPLSANGSDQDSPRSYGRDLSSSRRSPMGHPNSRPSSSYVDQLSNVPYKEQVAPSGSIINQSLSGLVGRGASLLDPKKTIEMYRANVKHAESSVQYEFAILLINTARDATPESGLDPSELVNESKHILQRLADRAYPFAQYYLGDGYFSGLFSKDKPDQEKGFSFFLAASKHGHAEASYRAALCYEFGWGTAKSYPKAVQFYRASAAKNHPGAATRLGLACIHGDMGMGREKYREGVKWMKRAQESADFQYNTAPYELGVLHLTGFGDDIFKDERYAAQLFTQSAELGHAEANFLMGQAYETALYGCPRDTALSVHFYNGAATKGHPDAMMALCAWYMVGASPVLEKDEAEAYAWAKEAARTGYPKAEYAIGYFTEMGIGCRRDPLEANKWYVRAADQGDQKAKQRLQIIRDAASGNPGVSSQIEGKKDRKKFMGLF